MHIRYRHNKCLDDLGLKYGTDKASNHHDYLHFYESRLNYLREKGILLIEIGVYHGSSIAMWREYFQEATVVGIDYNPDCKKYETNHINVRIGDGASVDFLGSIIKEFGSPMIVIDDGSHRWDHQIRTFQFLFPLMQAGGHYVIEDIDTSFETHLKQAPFQGESDISAFDYIYKLSRVVVGEAALGSERPYDEFIAQHAKAVYSIEHFRRATMINKK